MLNFTTDEIDLLVADGFIASFMRDIRVGDLVAIPPVTRESWTGEPRAVESLRIQRILQELDDDLDEHGNDISPHFVLNFIGLDIDDRPIHKAFGHTYPCFIKKGGND